MREWEVGVFAHWIPYFADQRSVDRADAGEATHVSGRNIVSRFSAEREKIRAVFELVITLLESNQRRLDELANIVFSLQSTVRGLDPTFDDVLQQKTDEIKSATEPLLRKRDEQFSEIRRLIASFDLG